MTISMKMTIISITAIIDIGISYRYGHNDTYDHKSAFHGKQ